MPQEIKILIVEDTTSAIEVYSDTIKVVNGEIAPDYSISAIYAKTKDEGIHAIESIKDLDGAFIDLKLQQGAPPDLNEGNDVIAEIYEKKRYPIFVLTGTPNEISPSFKQSFFLKVKGKTDVDYRVELHEVVKIFKTGITKILGKRGLIEKMLDSIFWENISHSLKDWIGISESEKYLLRYTLTHLQEHLEVTEDGLEFDKFFPIENYIIPSIKKYFCTGDIVNLKAEKNKRYVILTPACDLAPHGGVPKAKDVLLAEIQPLSDGIFLERINFAKKIPANAEDEKAISVAKLDVEKLISNNSFPKYYYLPNVSTTKGGLINFQKLLSIRFADLNANYEKEATITPQFVKDIVAKFSFYYSRQGSPDFDLKELLKKHLS